MRVCILTETFHPVVGGGESQARSLAEAFVARGHSVVVLTRRTDRNHPARENLGSIFIRRVGPSGSGPYHKWGLAVSTLPALLKLRREYDVVLVSGFRILGAPAVILTSRLQRPCVLKADSLGEMSGRFFEAGLRRIGLSTNSVVFRLFLSMRDVMLKRASAFVAISEAVRRELVDHGVDNQQIRTIPNSVDVDRFCAVDAATRLDLRRKLELPEDKCIVIFTGRLVTYKGLPLLLRVWADMVSTNTDLLLLVVGPGGLDMHNCEEELKQFVRENRLKSSVTFTGAVANINEYLQASDIFVFPTEREAFGISLVEAMACGLPAISTDVGGLQDIVRHQVNGLTVQPNEPDQLETALKAVIKDRDLARRLGVAGRKTAVARYSTDTVADAYIGLFSELK